MKISPTPTDQQSSVLSMWKSVCFWNTRSFSSSFYSVRRKKWEKNRDWDRVRKVKSSVIWFFSRRKKKKQTINWTTNWSRKEIFAEWCRTPRYSSLIFSSFSLIKQQVNIRDLLHTRPRTVVTQNDRWENVEGKQWDVYDEVQKQRFYSVPHWTELNTLLTTTNKRISTV